MMEVSNMKLYHILAIFFLLHLSTVSADTNGIWTYPRDITPGTFGEDESSNYSQNYTFNHPVIFNGNLTTNTLFDLDNPYYLVNPSGVSSLNSIVAGIYYSVDPNYFLNPQGESNLNFTDIYDLHVQGVDINDMFVNVGEEDSITGDMIVDETIDLSDLNPTLQDAIAGIEEQYSSCSLCNSYECSKFGENKYISGSVKVVCGVDFGDGLAQGNHNEYECELIGGSVVTLNSGLKVCKVSSCPSGWTHYKGYTETSKSSCSDNSCRPGSCTTGSHSLSSEKSNTETCSYDIGSKGWDGWEYYCRESYKTCTAKVTAIACV